MSTFTTIKNQLKLSFMSYKKGFYTSLFLTLLFLICVVELILLKNSITTLITAYQDWILMSLFGVVCGLFWISFLKGPSGSKTQHSNLTKNQSTTNSQFIQPELKLSSSSQESILQTHYRGIIFNKGQGAVKTYLIPQDSDYSPTYLPTVEQRVHSETDRKIDLRVLKTTSSHSMSFKQPILQTNPLHSHQFSFLFSHNHLSLN